MPRPAFPALLRADLVNALERNTRLTMRVRQLEKCLSEELGRTVCTESGLGAPADLDQLQHRITQLEQQLVDTQDQLDERRAGRGPRRQP